ncbi:hypothetical protein A5893_06280 [Pedobacter psychrophilus]|uniref:Uncharacterized protein n=1 Tax=Pedobacter psychrophilus TaxID=1826909 RepID=A0A179DHP8_9SPHI|nr:hypothetical protein [Pedobacter psychrophilus]OAQ40551.1 hypothetical protein A5893_06280 [Pedobacter psychrophilus]
MRKLILLLFFFPFILNAQDLTGFWKGKLTQDSGGYAPQYVLELNITQKNKKITGVSNAYLGNVVVGKLSFSGYFEKDSIYLSEFRYGVIEKILPPDYFLCIKNFILKYKNTVGLETLTGRWDGSTYAKDELGIDELFTDVFGDKREVLECVPGLISLSKNDSLHIQTTVPTQYQAFADSLNQTKVNLIEEVDVENQVIQIAINDYEKVDGDKITIIFNGDTIAEKVMVRKNPETFTLELSKQFINNELLIYAENLGRIPPNTCSITVIDGDKTHVIYLSSDFKYTGAIYFNFKGHK